MSDKMPYYMAYPDLFFFDRGREDKRDLEYFKSMYPKLAKYLLPYVEEECDRMEYENSMIYDQYPDKLQLRLLCGRIRRRIEEDGAEPEDKVKELIEVMVYQELYKRRCDRRRKHRRFY